MQISVLILTMDQVRDLVDAARSWSNSTTVGEHVDVDGLGSFAEGGCSHYGNHSGGSGCELPWVESNVFITGIITVAIILPLSLVRKISALRWSSGFAVVALMYTVVLVTAEGAMKLASSTNSTYGGGDVSSAILANARGAEIFGPPSTASGASIAAAAGVGNSSSSNSTGSIWWNPTFDGVLEATPLIVFSFGCQAQVIPLFNAMYVVPAVVQVVAHVRVLRSAVLLHAENTPFPSSSSSSSSSSSLLLLLLLLYGLYIYIGE